MLPTGFVAKAGVDCKEMKVAVTSELATETATTLENFDLKDTKFSVLKKLVLHKKFIGLFTM